MPSIRQLTILKAIVEEFIETAEPVGSKLLMQKYHLPYSSATIRNDMAALEEMGFLEKTHTSSGRVPSANGYRYYVEHLLETKVEDSVKHEMQVLFQDRSRSLYRRRPYLSEGFLLHRGFPLSSPIPLHQFQHQYVHHFYKYSNRFRLPVFLHQLLQPHIGFQIYQLLH